MIANFTEDKFQGCLLGAAIGDAIGQVVGDAVWHSGERELRNCGLAIQAFVDLLTELRYTDDTHMTIAVAESLIECKGFDRDRLAQRLLINWEKEPWRGYAPGPPRIFEMVKEGESWSQAVSEVYPGGSYGNGAAMRVSPLGLFFNDRPGHLIEAVYHSSRITHYHPLGVEGAILQAMAVALAVQETPGRSFAASLFLDEICGYAVEETYRIKLQDMKLLLTRAADTEQVVNILGHGVEAFNSIPTAIFCFLVNPNSFTDTVSYAISLGGDTDTIASMAGAISGAYLGAQAIPDGWLVKLESRDYLKILGDKLWSMSRVIPDNRRR